MPKFKKITLPIFVTLGLLIILSISFFIYLIFSGVKVTYNKFAKEIQLEISDSPLARSLYDKYPIFRKLNISDVDCCASMDGVVDESVFGKITENSTLTAEQSKLYLNLSPDIVEKYKGDPDGLYFFRIGWGIDKVEENDIWDYKSSAFVAGIISYNKDTNELELKVKSPVSMPFYGQTTTVITNCDSSKSYLGRNGTNTNPVDDLMKNYALSSSEFIGQCFDESCSIIGEFCKVEIR